MEIENNDGITKKRDNIENNIERINLTYVFHIQESQSVDGRFVNLEICNPD